MDTPPTSQNHKVKRRFTFKRDKKKSKKTQDTIEESLEHPRGFREAFNSSPSPNKTDGQNSENSSLASGSALRLSVPNDLCHLNHSNSASAENISGYGANSTSLSEGKSEMRGSISAEFESQEVRVPFRVEVEDDGKEGGRGWLHDSQPGVHQSQVTVEVSSSDGGDGGSGAAHRSSKVGDAIRLEEKGRDRAQPEASSPPFITPSTTTQSEDAAAVFLFPSPTHSTVPNSTNTPHSSRADTTSRPDLPAPAKTPLAPLNAEGSASSSPDHHGTSPSSSSSSNSTPTKTKTVTITRKISESHALRKLPTQKEILSRYGRASVSSDLGAATALRVVKETEAVAHARSSSDLALPSRLDSYVYTPALSAAPPLPPRPVTSLGFTLSSSSLPKESNGKAAKVLDEEEVLKTCSIESLISAIENSRGECVCVLVNMCACIPVLVCMYMQCTCNVHAPAHAYHIFVYVLV